MSTKRRRHRLLTPEEERHIAASLRACRRDLWIVLLSYRTAGICVLQLAQQRFVEFQSKWPRSANRLRKLPTWKQPDIQSVAAALTEAEDGRTAFEVARLMQQIQPERARSRQRLIRYRSDVHKTWRRFIRIRNQLVKANIPLVYHCAFRQREQEQITREDMVQEGMLGLVRAAERFDDRRKVRFSTYAMWWIKATIRRSVQKQKLVRLSFGSLRQLRDLEEARRTLMIDGEPINEENLLKRTGMTREQLVRLVHAPRLQQDEQSLLDRGGIDPEEQAIQWEILGQVMDELEELPQAHKEVLERRLGMDGEPETLQHVADELGYSREWVRLAERKALEKLQKALQDPV